MASLLEKKEQRLRFMHRLYEVTDGSPLVDVESTRIGEEFGWSEQETDRVIEYLMGEGLVEYFAGGNMINVTHAGVVEVEAALDNPDRGTAHFPPAGNVIVIGHMHSSQIQQGTEGSQQLATFNEPNRDQLLTVVGELLAILPNLALDKEDRQEAEAELGTAEVQLGSNRPKWPIIRASLGRVVSLVERVSSLATRSVELTRALEILHKELPGV